ncbi:LAQU0S20e00958g1_1 [Lachancea quebecensis]|uniref:LAQU0S20e00958g1_1 n=1 Tax=Lachancea quebecensis TaxID=1654605 RepID=A0A0P1KXL1_9SACH|nr:LAQU0S20e00958g1_1 [Lachancea quebecensis]
MAALEHIPVLHPTAAEMEDPIGFLSQTHIRRLGHVYGMVKLVPPSVFRPPLSINEDQFKFRVRLQHLNELNILNRGRLFLMKQLNNFYMRGSRRAGKQLKKPYTEMGDKRLFYYDLFITITKFFNPSGLAPERNVGRKRPRSNTVSFESQAATGASATLKLTPLSEVENNQALWKHVTKELDVPQDFAKDAFFNILAPYYEFLQKKTREYGGSEALLSKLIYSEKFPNSLLNDTKEGEEGEMADEDDEEEEEGCTLCQRTNKRTKTILCDSCDRPFHIFCLDPPLDEVPKGKWVCNNCIFGNGYYGFKEEDRFYSRTAFKEMCREYDAERWPDGDKLENLEILEKMFWDKVEQIDRSSPIRYGADIHNAGPGEMTGFPTAQYVPPAIKNDEHAYKQYLGYVRHPMNLVNLPSAKGSLLSVFGKKISGMTVPWIYIGSTFSTFCWHLEDQYTLSANYQHEGDPKIWYSIPESSCEKFDRLMRDTAPDLFQKQPDLLHQLVTLIAPYDKRFREAKISCFKAIQYPGEYIITFPKCYHSGFNSGYNFNEAVNFTLDLWLPYGIEATRDYVGSGKRCVFDMWELMLTVLVEYLNDSKKFDESLIRSCHTELEAMFNQEVKSIEQLSKVLNNRAEATGITRRHIGDKTQVDVKVTVRHEYRKADFEDEDHANTSDEDFESDDDGDDDIFCAACKTICPFFFVAHIEKSRLSKRRRLESMRPTEWNQMSERGEIKIFCLRDYIKLLESETEDDQSDYSGDGNGLEKLQRDELFLIRKPDEIRNVLRKVQHKLDEMLR